MSFILDGKMVRDSIARSLKERVASFRIKPKLAIIQIGDLSESSAYIKQKKLFGDRIEAIVDHLRLSNNATDQEIVDEIHKLNDDETVHGIIVQLPLPARLKKDQIIDAISPIKDVDGLTSDNARLLLGGGGKGFVPATAKGVKSLLDYYKIKVLGKKVVVMGRSSLVGRPIAELMEREGAEVTVCHSKTENVSSITKQTDILIVAIGKPKFVTAGFVNSKQVVIDVGINLISGEKLEEEVPKKQLVGDVDFDSVSTIVSAISPVPGGVGPMTVASLFENLIQAYEHLR